MIDHVSFSFISNLYSTLLAIRNWRRIQRKFLSSFASLVRAGGKMGNILVLSHINDFCHTPNPNDGQYSTFKSGLCVCDVNLMCCYSRHYANIMLPRAVVYSLVFVVVVLVFYSSSFCLSFDSCVCLKFEFRFFFGRNDEGGGERISFHEPTLFWIFLSSITCQYVCTNIVNIWFLFCFSPQTFSVSFKLRKLIAQRVLLRVSSMRIWKKIYSKYFVVYLIWQLKSL